MAQPGYAVEHQPVVLNGVTELLVHGVGGESAEGTLHEPHPMQVAGDATAGFYRGPDVHGRHRESYSWGGLTSGKASRALWLLLLPFALANLAGWMHWRDRGEREPGSFRSLIRLFGLSLTVLGLLYVCSIAFDLIAYQCGADPACIGAQRSSQPWYSPLRWMSFLDAGWLAGHQFRQLAAAALLPLVVVGLLGFLARSQGTVLAVAALQQLVSSSAPAVGRVGLVTYGAPLTRLYRRAFPAYFGNGIFAALRETVGTPTSRWRNFHRKTDLIGGPVFTGPDDRHRGADECLLDPSTRWYVPRDPTPPVLGHSSYMRDPSMDRYVEGLAGQFLTEMGTEAPEDPPAVLARS
jgi:hypothetical protein